MAIKFNVASYFFFIWNRIFFRFAMKKVFFYMVQLKKDKDGLGNFETDEKIDTGHILRALLKTILLFYY